MTKVFHRTHETFIPQNTLPAKYYTSQDIFETEKEKFFGGWICVGHQSRIPKPGDHFVFELFTESVIIARNKTGQINALTNVCRHRGTLICKPDKDTKHSMSVQCPYHAWTYDLDGKLIGAPHMKDVPGFTLQNYPLGRLPVYVWEGFIFVSFDKDEIPFEEVYAPLIGMFSKWKLGRTRSERRIPYDVHSNWKLIFLNFSECYHCPTAHPLLNTRIDYLQSQNDLTEGHILGGFFEINAASMTKSGNLSAIPLSSELGEDISRAHYYTVMPNLLINLHPDYMMYHILIPVSPGQTKVVSEWLFNPDAWGREDFHPEDAVDIWHSTNQEDWELTENAQRGISSKFYEEGPYSDRESLLTAFDRHFLKVMRNSEKLEP